MKSAKSVRRVVLSLIGAFITVGAVSGVVQAAQSTPDFAIAISPTSQSVQRGQTASYTVTVTSLNGFSGAVSLSTSGGPAGTVLGATTVTPTAGTVTTTTLKASTTSSTNVGSYTITVGGVSAKLNHSASTGLTVTYPATPGFALSMVPTSLSLTAGSSGTYTVTLARTNGFTGAVSVSLFRALPAGVTATFSPQTLSGAASTSTLTINTTTAAQAGSTTVYIVGASGSLYAYSQGTLVIAQATSQGQPFTINSGSISGLSPGVSRVIDLTLSNPNKSNISVTSLNVALTSTSKGSCPTTNFDVKQYTGTYPITVPAGGNALLTGIPADKPAVTMKNTSSNQDGCKGVTLSLSYSGTAQGN